MSVCALLKIIYTSVFVFVSSLLILTSVLCLQRMVPERKLPGGVCVDRNHSAFVAS